VTVLSITALAKSFFAGTPTCSARVRVLRDLDLALWPGEVVALVGRDGSGRSTLLRCAAGLLRPEAGSICWFGARACPHERVAYVSAVVAPTPSRDTLRCNELRDRGGSGALYAAVARALEQGVRILLVDDLPCVGALERRLVLALFQRCAHSGTCIVFAASDELVCATVVSRVVALDDGALTHRRKRSAARIAASSPASRARVSARSTYERSLRSPQ